MLTSTTALKQIAIPLDLQPQQEQMTAALKIARSAEGDIKETRSVPMIYVIGCL